MSHTRIGVSSAATLLSGGMAAILLLSVGCTKKPAQPLVPPQSEVTLKVACPDDVSAEMIRKFSRDWLRRQGGKIEFVSTNADLPDADIVVMDPVRMPSYASAGQLLAVPEEYQSNENDYNWRNLLTAYRAKLLAWEEHKYGLPLIGEATVLYYREDLFQAAEDAFQKQHQKPLKPPANWDELLQIAAFFDALPEKQFETSMAPLPSSDIELDRTFHAIAASIVRDGVKEDEAKKPSEAAMFSFHYDVETGHCRIDTQGFVQALELLKKTCAHRPKEPVDNPEEHFRQGKSVLCIGRASYVGRLQTDSKARKKFGVCAVPGSTYVIDYESGAKNEIGSNAVAYQGVGGLIGVVPASSKQGKEAFELLAEMSSAKYARESVVDPQWGGGPYRTEQFAREAWESLDLGAKVTGSMLDALRHNLRPSIINPVMRLRVPDAEVRTRILMEEIRKELAEDQADLASALCLVKDRWLELDRGIADPLTLYRLSLGLKPKH